MHQSRNWRRQGHIWRKTSRRQLPERTQGCLHGGSNTPRRPTQEEKRGKRSKREASTEPAGPQ
eukprot:5826641-Prorocentrum_lima.AAC.1